MRGGRAHNRAVTIIEAIKAELARRDAAGGQHRYRQADAAKDLGVSYHTFSNWLTHRSLPSAQHLRKLSRWLSMESDDVLDLIEAARHPELRIMQIEATVDRLVKAVEAQGRAIDRLRKGSR